MAIPQPIEIDPAWLSGFALQATPDKPVKMTVKWSRGEKKMLRKKRDIRPSKWVENHIVLPQDSPMPGRWKNDTTPYLAGIMDASFFDSVQEIIVCAAPQTGKTQCVINCLGYAADRKPGNVLWVAPNEKESGDTCKDRLQTTIRDSKRLASYRTGYEDDETTLKIKLQHQIIHMAWATSAARLAQRPLPYGVADEENKYPLTVGKKEAGPVDLLRKRMRNFPHMRKLWRLSSPTKEDEGVSRALEGCPDPDNPGLMIAPEAEVVFDFWVHCPDCGAMQKMNFEQIKWPDGSGADARIVETKKTAHYECEKCNSEWSDAKRNFAVRMGEWRDREKGLSLFTYLKTFRPRVIGFHIPAWLSPFVSLSECAAAFLKGLKDKIKLKDFLNGFAAGPWKEYVKERHEDRILLLRDDRPRGRVPGGGVVAGLLASVDTQDHGLWYRIRAFGYGGTELLKESWGIREGYLAMVGSDKKSDFRALERVLWEDQYLDAEGNRYPVMMTIQDALGHRTSEVYDFCRKHRGRIFPSFGRDTMAQPFTWRNLEYYPGRQKPIPGGLKAINVNTKYYKDELSRILEVDPADPGAWHENAEFAPDWARHMTAEFTNEKGLWECPSGKANHLWDCAVLCLVAHDIQGMMHWKVPENQETPGQKTGRKVRSVGIGF